MFIHILFGIYLITYCMLSSCIKKFLTGTSHILTYAPPHLSDEEIPNIV